MIWFLLTAFAGGVFVGWLATGWFIGLSLIEEDNS